MPIAIVREACLAAKRSSIAPLFREMAADRKKQAISVVKLEQALVAVAPEFFVLDGAGPGETWFTEVRDVVETQGRILRAGQEHGASGPASVFDGEIERMRLPAHRKCGAAPELMRAGAWDETFATGLPAAKLRDVEEMDIFPNLRLGTTTCASCGREHGWLNCVVVRQAPRVWAFAIAGEFAAFVHMPIQFQILIQPEGVRIGDRQIVTYELVSYVRSVILPPAGRHFVAIVRTGDGLTSARLYNDTQVLPIELPIADGASGIVRDAIRMAFFVLLDDADVDGS
jgi:hypothetical protein